jgi:hypothetical protein
MPLNPVGMGEKLWRENTTKAKRNRFVPMNAIVHQELLRLREQSTDDGLGSMRWQSMAVETSPVKKLPKSQKGEQVDQGREVVSYWFHWWS